MLINEHYMWKKCMLSPLIFKTLLFYSRYYLYITYVVLEWFFHLVLEYSYRIPCSSISHASAALHQSIVHWPQFRAQGLHMK
jgi:hypothetical protein